MKRHRYFVERRHGPKDYAPIGSQPAEGFESPKAAMDWLAERGWIRRRLSTVDGQPFWEGWGGERGFYVRAVAQRLATPYEVGAYGSIFAVESVERTRWSWLGILADRIKLTLRRDNAWPE